MNLKNSKSDQLIILNKKNLKINRMNRILMVIILNMITLYVFAQEKNYETSNTMNIYTDKNTNIFSKDHTSFWSTDNACKITLQHLLKHTPIYKK